jgi:hypothetical protein
MVKRDGRVESNQGHKKQREQIANIVDALHDGWLRYTAKVAIYPIMDTLQLLVQKPSAFAIIRLNGKKADRIFPTYFYPEYEKNFKNKIDEVIGQLERGRVPKKYAFELVGSSDRGPSFCLFASRISGVGGNAAFLPFDSEDRMTLRELITALGRDTELSKHFKIALEEISKKKKPGKKVPQPMVNPPLNDQPPATTSFNLSGGDQKNYVDSMRNIVSTALSEVAHSPILDHGYANENGDDGRKWLNLYCSIRRAVPKEEKRNGIFPYTVQYVLSGDQQETINHHFERKISEKFEIPLGKQCVSNSDPIFYSGVNEFTYELQNFENRGREDAEQKILGLQTAAATEVTRKFFIVPIHVGGVVWATLFTTPLSHPDLNKDWSRNYYLYRILLTQIAERFRVAAKDEYRACLRKVFESEMEPFENGKKGENIGTICDRINGEWRKLTAYFPYEGVELRLIAKHDGDEKKFVTLKRFRNEHDCFGESLLPGFDRLEAADLAVLKSQLNARFDHALTAVDRRRFALRTASAAIMGRNMSHNIGSHVLARYSNEVSKEREPEKKTDEGTPKPSDSKRGALDHRGEFLSYLQRRMDFLAEVATSDRAFWSAPVSLRNQVKRLNFGDERKLYRSGEPILLSHITGKGGLNASVEWGNLTDSTGKNVTLIPSPSLGRVACPGGEVGIQAFFVILENIIRNSARHGPARPEPISEDGSTPEGKTVDWVRLFLNVDEEGDSGFVKIDIIDPRTKLDHDGHTATTRNAGKPPLHDYINSILAARLTESDGAPIARNWGIREMQICAYYLRRISLFDLEIAKTPPVLRANIHPLPSGKVCLKYTLYMERPKLMAAVVRDAEKWSSCKNALLIKGVEVVAFEGSWNKIAEQVSQYGFLLVDNAFSLPKARTPDRASLPIRALKLAEDEISSRINAALKADGMEWAEVLLHKKWAEECQNKRVPWQGKKIWGVAVAGNKDRAIDYDCIQLPKTPDGRSEGLFCVEVSGGQLDPLPNRKDVWKWHATLETQAVATVWLDHVANAKFGEREFDAGGVAIGQVAVQPSELDWPRFWISAEALFSDSPHAEYLNGCAKDGGWEILAAAVARVVVFDERVQFELNNETRSGLSLWDTLRCMGVWVPKVDQCCNLEEPKFGPCRKFLKKPAFERPDQIPIDIFVIHLSVLEALKKGSDRTLKKTLEQLIAGTEAQEAEIVIVTGRGVPDIDIDNVRCLPISALLESLVRRPSKLALMRSLWSASCPPQTSSGTGKSDGN